MFEHLVCEGSLFGARVRDVDVLYVVIFAIFAWLAKVLSGT